MRGVKNMSDRDIVVNEFEQWCDSMNEDCPVACLDALALLKEQEAVTPSLEASMYKCGNCEWAFFSNNPYCLDDMKRAIRFCPRCGRAVKWE